MGLDLKITTMKTYANFPAQMEDFIGNILDSLDSSEKSAASQFLCSFLKVVCD